MKFLIGLVLGFIIGWAINWFLQTRPLKRSTRTLAECRDKLANAEEKLAELRAKITVAEPAKTPEAARPAVENLPYQTQPSRPDDLKEIGGIGPKIAALLRADGITTFTQLADADVERLQRILNSAGGRYRLADPSTWPAQAKLAAAGDWDGLENLKEQLNLAKRTRRPATT